MDIWVINNIVLLKENAYLVKTWTVQGNSEPVAQPQCLPPAEDTHTHKDNLEMTKTGTQEENNVPKETLPTPPTPEKNQGFCVSRMNWYYMVVIIDLRNVNSS